MLARLLYLSCVVSLFVVAALVRLAFGIKPAIAHTIRTIGCTVPALIERLGWAANTIKTALTPFKAPLVCAAALAGLYGYLLYTEPPLIPTPQPKHRQQIPLHISRGNPNSMEIALTFDGGQQAGDTELILNILKSRNRRATIFLTGRFIENNPRLVVRMIKDGHEIGNHTMTHPHLTTYATNFQQDTLPWVNREFLKEELLRTEALFRALTGRSMAPLWRAPYGEINRQILGWARELGYTHVGWTADRERKESLDSLDWVSDPSSRFYLTAAEMEQRILGFGRGSKGLRGAIILMHLDTARTEERLSERLGYIVDRLMAEGYRFVPVSRLIESAHTTRVAMENRAKAQGR